MTKNETMAYEICGGNFKFAILQHILMVSILGTSSEIALMWIPEHFIDDESTLVQVKAWCRQTSNPYLWSNVG